MQCPLQRMSQFCIANNCNMKFTLLLILCFCLCSLAYGNDVIATKPPFVRSRYSLRWRKTTTIMPLSSTTGRVMEQVATSTQHPESGKLQGTSTASPDYDYYGTGEAADNLVHK